MSTGDKIKHKAEELKGAAKEKLGDATVTLHPAHS
jgi:uncharacterized protein YjbJ (UPF0337 family)